MGVPLIASRITAKEENDPVTGITRIFIKSILADEVPKIIIGEKDYQLPIGAMPIAREGQTVSPGDVIAKIPKQSAKNVDITGGLTLVLELLEVRKVKHKAVMTEIDGEVRIGPPRQGQVPIEVVSDTGEKREYRAEVGEQLNFYNGDQIKAGDLLHDGAIAIEDVLRVRKVSKLQLPISSMRFRRSTECDLLSRQAGDVVASTGEPDHLHSRLGE